MEFQGDEEVDRGGTIIIPTATTDRLSKEGSDSFFPSTYNIKRESLKFKKASSLDSSFILTERKSSPPNLLPQSNANAYVLLILSARTFLFLVLLDLLLPS